MELPKTLEDIQKKFIDAQVQESLHLDYKDSRALINNKARTEIAKDVSAFANSDGGMLIYGVQEQNHLPLQIDSGVDHAQMTREQLEGIITSNIAPHIEGLQIFPIPTSNTHFIYAVKIPKSFKGPHQESGGRYYRRLNFQSRVMEDYEIREAYNRRRIVPPLINVDSKVKGGIIELVISNVGDSVAQDIKFEISKGMK